MLAIALIIFRESLEAALFVGIVAAATRGLLGRASWLGAGVMGGALGAVILALLAGHLSGWLGGLGQEVVNIGILSAALAMLLWHSVWVSTHTKEMVSQANQLGHSVQHGRRTPWALVIVVGLSVLREGAETVLFVFGSLTGAHVQPGSVLMAGALGLACGVLVGVVIYVGLARIPVRHVFSVTNVLIALIAASLASQLARTLAQAGFIDTWITPLWDSSWLLSPDSALGTFLHALMGYDAQPSAAQLAVYLGTLAFIVVGTRLLRPKAGAPQAARQAGLSPH